LTPGEERCSYIVKLDVSSREQRMARVTSLPLLSVSEAVALHRRGLQDGIHLLDGIIEMEMVLYHHRLS
jgi:hypothetical protein